MQPIIYDVAVSIDGFIAGPGGDIAKFSHDGEVVEDYRSRLHEYACVIMGRATYEFGYRFGLKPGQNPYPHAETLVFSTKLDLPTDGAVTVIRDDAETILPDLREKLDGPIYLCGGGQFAGALAGKGLIDVLRLKRAPIILGEGTSLFGDAAPSIALTCVGTKHYADGYLFQEFGVQTV